jgi:hypothetical protein
MIKRLKMSTGMLLDRMEMMEKNMFSGVLIWLNLTKLVFPGLCVKNRMLHPQWYIFIYIIIMPFF